jgi:uncharacterized protein YlxP (DUF503 family)
MPIAVLNLHLFLAGCTSLKEKRSRIKPLLARLHREFNLSVAEMDLLDHWREARIACVVISNDAAHCQRVLQTVLEFTEHHFPDVEVADHQIEMI